MELRQLRYFVALAEELHFARAATRVGIAQSPLSKAIKDFEADLGVRLITRTTRSVELTRSGEVLLADARRILAAAAEAEQSVRAAGGGIDSRVTVGFVDGIYLPDASAIRREHFGNKLVRLRPMS